MTHYETAISLELLSTLHAGMRLFCGTRSTQVQTLEPSYSGDLERAHYPLEFPGKMWTVVPGQNPCPCPAFGSPHKTHTHPNTKTLFLVDLVRKTLGSSGTGSAYRYKGKGLVGALGG